MRHYICSQNALIFKFNIMDRVRKSFSKTLPYHGRVFGYSGKHGKA
jgi:hypothetical protein